MAMQIEPPHPSPSAQFVGNVFVDQYYHLLHQSPELVYRFYQDTSVLSRPDPDGLMMRVTTTESINDIICSLDYTNYKAEIRTADAQASFNDGVIVLVTGCLIGKDNLRKKFTQTFFLAPQDTGYYVLNDVFRYVEDVNEGMVTGVDETETPSSSLNQEPEPAQVIDSPNANHATSDVEEIETVEEKVNNQLTDEREASNDRDIVVEVQSSLNDNHEPVVEELVTSELQEDATKKSYASIVSSQTKKGPTKVPIKVYVPANTPKVASAKTEKPSVNTEPQESKEVEGHSIYIRNLPLNATVAQLETEFKKFGTIKPNGVQVRSNKLQGFCFGFVEFEEFDSMQNAIKASPITIGDRQAAVEIKKTTTRVGNGSSHFTSRGGIHNGSFRGRGGNFNGGRNYVRHDSFRSRGNFSRAEGYQHGRGTGQPGSTEN